MAAVSLIGYKNARHPPGNLGHSSVTKSTLTGGVYISGRDKRLVFASEWLFKPEGIRDVKIKFQEALKQNALIADHEWDSQEMVFRVRCVVSVTPKVSALFSGILGGIISEAHGDDYVSDDDEDFQIMVTNQEGEEVLFESDKIERISAWKKRHGVMEENAQSRNTTHNIDMPANEADPEESTDELGSRALIWTCNDSNLLLDDIASDDVLVALKDLTGCDFKKDLSQGKVIISHSSVENCQLAIKKLDNIKKYAEPMSPYITHIFYAEDMRRFQLRPCRFFAVKKKFFKTTLLNPYTTELSVGYLKLARAVTIRAAIWSETSSGYTPALIKKIVPATDPLDTLSNYRGLLSFKYFSKGNPENNPLRYLMEVDEHQGSTIETRPAALSILDSDNLEEIKHGLIEGWAQEIVGETPINDLPDREPVRIGSNFPMLTSSVATELEGLTLTGNVDGLSDPLESDTAPLTQSMANVERSLLDEDMPGMSFAPLVPLRLSSAPLLSTSSELSKSSRQVSQIHQSTNAQCQPVDRDLAASRYHENPAPGPFQPDIRTAAHQSAVELKGKGKITGKSSLAHGVSLPPIIRLQPPKVSDPQQDQDPTPEFIAELKNAFPKLVTGLQGFPGEIIVQAEFGKIILRKIGSKFITSDDNARSFSQNEILSQFGSHARTHFTNILTTLPTDMGYLLNIKGQTNRAMWEQTAAESTLIYEISCHNDARAGWNPFTIEINGKTFDTRIKTRFDFGTLNVHGILRHWDFRVTAFGFGDDIENEKLYGEFTRAIQRSLYIPPELPRPCLFFELDNSFLENSKLVIDSILVHQIETHQSTDSKADSILKISKIMALDVDSMCPFQGANFQIYKAELPPPESQHEPGALNVWYEASISSTKCNKELRQNTAMELGDEAGWTPKTLEELDVVNDIYLPACEMLKQMDGVGINNDNGVEFQEQVASEQSPPKEYVFW